MAEPPLSRGLLGRERERGLGLNGAMSGLPSDRGTEAAVLAMLEIMRLRAGEWLRAADLTSRVGLSEQSVSVILSVLAEHRVLNKDGERYRYVYDRVVDLDIERFVRRSRQHQRFTQSNVAKFRDLYGRH